MTGGEDYEVLAAVPEARAGKFEAMAAATATRVTQVGLVEPASAGIAIRDAAGNAMTFARDGWDHFRDMSVS
jgi:thiamine-monophosphate kinase